MSTSQRSRLRMAFACAHFLSIGDHVRAFGAINYAHAWIDAGVKIGLLDGHGDDVLFTLP